MAKKAAKERFIFLNGTPLIEDPKFSFAVLCEWWPAKTVTPEKAVRQRWENEAEERRGEFWRENLRIQPVKAVKVARDGRSETAYAVKDTLDWLYDDGVIGDAAYNAGRAFQDEFERCSYGHMASVNLEGTAGGTMDVYEIYRRSKKSRDYVHNVMTMLGGPQNCMAVAVFWIVGMRVSLNKLKGDSGKGKDFWRGCLLSALGLMGDDYARMQRGLRSRGRIQYADYYPDEEST